MNSYNTSLLVLLVLVVSCSSVSKPPRMVSGPAINAGNRQRQQHASEIRRLIETINDEPEDPLHAMITKSGRKLIALGDLDTVMQLSPLLTAKNSDQRVSVLLTICGIVEKHFGLKDEFDQTEPNLSQYLQWLHDTGAPSMPETEDDNKMQAFRVRLEKWISTTKDKK